MEIQPYGAMIAIGVLAAGAVGRWLAKKFSIDFNDVILMFAYALSLGFIGAKCAYLLLNFRRIPWREMGLMNVIADGGYIFYGGIPFGMGGLLLAGKIHGIELRKYLRVCGPLLPLGHAFGRVGCSLAGCCYGVSYSGPLAVTYHHSLIAPNTMPLFPVQLLEAVLLLGLAIVLLAAVLRGVSFPGMVGLYFGGYAVMRFGLEFLRGDLERGVAAGLSTSQWISVGVLVGLIAWQCGSIIIKRRDRMKKILSAISCVAVLAAAVLGIKLFGRKKKGA